MGSMFGGKPPKPDTAAQEKQLAEQKAENERLQAASNSKKKAQLGRNSGSRSLLTGLESGVLKDTLG